MIVAQIFGLVGTTGMSVWMLWIIRSTRRTITEGHESEGEERDGQEGGQPESSV